MTDPALAAAMAAAGLQKPMPPPASIDALAQDAPKARPGTHAKHGKQHLPWNAERLGALVLGLLTLLWAPMALVLFLGTGSTLGMFLVPQGARIIAADLRGYVQLTTIVLAALAVRYGVEHSVAVVPFYLRVPLFALKAVALLLAWGCAGLYIRSIARQLDVPCDDDDWVPASRTVVAPR